MRDEEKRRKEEEARNGLVIPPSKPTAISSRTKVESKPVSRMTTGEDWGSSVASSEGDVGNNLVGLLKN